MEGINDCFCLSRTPLPAIKLFFSSCKHISRANYSKMVSRIHTLRYITAEDLAHALINDSRQILIVDVRDHDYTVSEGDDHHLIFPLFREARFRAASTSRLMT